MKKINEPGKKIKITSVEDIVDEINKIIEIKNIEVKKHNNLVDNYQEEKKKLICDIWYLIAQENSEINQST